MTSQQITSDISVQVESFYQSTTSIPEESHYVFAYRVTIHNMSNKTVKLLRRHWQIVEADGNKREIEGQGVIGEQPILEPGEHHQYFSGCNLNTTIGKMYGSYLMEEYKNGQQFKVEIPEFVMATPEMMN